MDFTRFFGPQKLQIISCMAVTFASFSLPTAMAVNLYERWQTIHKGDYTNGLHVVLWNADAKKVKAILGSPQDIAPPKSLFAPQVSDWGYRQFKKDPAHRKLMWTQLNVKIGPDGRVCGTDIVEKVSYLSR